MDHERLGKIAWQPMEQLSRNVNKKNINLLVMGDEKDHRSQSILSYMHYAWLKTCKISSFSIILTATIQLTPATIKHTLTIIS